MSTWPCSRAVVSERWRPPAAPHGLVNVKLMVLDCTASLNVAVAVDDTATLVAPLAGVSLVTLAAPASVVNDQENGAAHGIAGAVLGPADSGRVVRVVGQGRTRRQSGRVVRAVVSNGCCNRAAPARGQREADRAGLHRLVERRGHRRRRHVIAATLVAPLAGDSLVTLGGAASVVNDQE